MVDPDIVYGNDNTPKAVIHNTSGNTYEISVKNNTSNFWVTFVIDFKERDNIKSDKPLPVTLENQSSLDQTEKINITVIKGDVNPQFKYKFSNPTNSPGAITNTTFAIPWSKDKEYSCLQSAGYKSSQVIKTHVGSLAMAADFEMPVGVPILAARSGTVVDFQDGSKGPRLWSGKIWTADTALSDMGNYVILRHDNYVYTTYQHLQGGSLRVDIGDSVNEGSLIGKSGDTGKYSQYKHLHFDVRKLVNHQLQTIEFKFLKDGKPVDINEGTKY